MLSVNWRYAAVQITPANWDDKAEYRFLIIFQSDQCFVLY